MTPDDHDAAAADRDRDARERADLEADRDGGTTDRGRAGGVSGVIGTLADRLRDRLGRDWGDCRTCGRPTRSHRLGSGVQCHRCYVAGERVALADGGDDLDAETVRALLERERIDPDTATVAQAIGAVDELTLDDRPLVATVLDGDDATTGSYPSDSNDTPPRGVTSEAPGDDQGAVDNPDSTREQPADKRGISDTRTAEHDGSEGATGLSSEDNPGGVTDETGNASASDDRRDRRDHRATDPADDESLGAGDTNRVRHTSDPGDVEDDTSTDERDTAGSGPTAQDKPGETDTRDHDDHDDERADHDLELTETRERDPVDTAGADDPDALDPDAGYLDVFRTAQRAHGSERWEYVTEDELRAALDRVGHADLLDRGILARGTDWRTVDFADDGDDDPDHRYYYVPAAPDPDPAEFRRFHDCLMAAAPDGYQPYYFRVEPVGKAPDTRYGSWKDEVNRLSFDGALAHMEDGGNVGIAGTPDGPLVNIDVDDGEATTPDDLPETLRAISRSRTGWHGWGFNPAADIPNLPTDDLGEVRTDWQYVVAPGSFVACAPEEIPDDADRPGYYTVENEAPVPTITFDDLPEAFREWENDRDETHPPTDAETGADLVDRGDDQDDQDDQDDDTDHDTASDVFDVDAGDVVRSEGGDTDVSERWTSLFHGSDTSANMSVSDKGRLQCWRHNVAHGGLQALATLSKHSPSGDRACRQIGTGHTHSNAGGCRYAGDWRLIWWAWEYAKGNGYLDDDGPIPFRALVNLAVRDDALDVDREDLVERETDDGGTYLGFPDAGAYNAALDHVRDEYDRDPGRVYAETGQDTSAEYHDVETCRPPRTDRDTADVEAIRDDLTGARYDRFVDADGPVIWADEPGTGKTTSAAIAADHRDRPHAVLAPDHEKAREFVTDEPTPDASEYFHLKGGEQKRHDVCMDADHADRDCPDHPSGACPHMCPVYDLDPDHPTRQAYEALTNEFGPRRAHFLLADDLHEHAGHDEDGRGPWLKQYDRLDHQDYVVGVHQYQTLKSVRDGRDLIVDEHPGADSVATERDLSVEDLVRMATALDEIGDVTREDLLGVFATWAREVIDAITTEGDADLAALDPPAVAPHATTTREAVGVPGDGHYRECDRIDEALARAKLTYHESLLSRITSDRLEWNEAPFAFDALLAAAAEAGLDAPACRRAIAAPDLLDACPRCGDDLDTRDGARTCPECTWHEHEDLLVPGDTEQRAIAWIGTDDQGRPAALATRRLPLSADLPDDPLVLNATPDGEPVAYLYDVDPADVTVEGDPPLAVENLHMTQVLTGQYHWNTIKQTDSLRDRIETTIGNLDGVHGDVLAGGRIAAHETLSIPDGVEWLNYHAARGKNRPEYDAAVAVGAPHPDVEDLRRDARLLAQGTDARVGGDEHSTRRDAPNPPVYRKLEFVDETGDGRAVPTKHYTGLVGRLFRQARERELEQFVHRVRPLLADETKHVYLLTNVPTRLPVDEVCSFDELTNPLQALLPVPAGALTLADHIRDVATGEAPNGFRAETLVGRDEDGRPTWKVDELHRLARAYGTDVSERTVRRWVNALVDVGLLDDGEYEPREGVPYRADPSTLTPALSVLSSNAGVEVAVQRRLRRLIEESTTPLEWLAAARDALALDGDRCRRDTPPPGGTAGANPG